VLLIPFSAQPRQVGEMFTGIGGLLTTMTSSNLVRLSQ